MVLLSYPFLSLYHKEQEEAPFRARGSPQSLGQCLIHKKSDCHSPLVTQLCLTLCNTNGRSMPGVPVLYHFPEIV